MPFTPFHFGPAACVAFSLNKKIDIPIFILANVAIDIEPLLVIIFNLSYPLHGFTHSFLGAALIGILWGIIAFISKGMLQIIMRVFKLPYQTTIKKAIFSGILGSWFHVLFDTPLYMDIKPFYPLNINPLYGLVSHKSMYLLFSVLFIPAVTLYIYTVRKYKKCYNK